LVPAFDQFYGTVLERIPYDRAAAIRVLDLGAGTGLLSALVAAAFPNAVLTLVDISPEMLGKARERFAGNPRVCYEVVDLEREALRGEYDVAVSALALHHLEHPLLAAVFRKAYDALVPGGVFINADQTLGTTPENERLYAEQWLADVRANGCTEAEVQAALDRMKVDKTATLENQLAWLRAAGFADVDCWYKRCRFAVYSGRKR
jgi:tRNA (cmo5U34)-methyltransferase